MRIIINQLTKHRIMKKTPNQLSRVAIAYHPGDTLKEKLNELGMSIKEFSVRTSKPEKTYTEPQHPESSIYLKTK